jgi:oligopeptide transport system permease protein
VATTALPREQVPERAELATKPRGLWADAFHRLARNRLALVGLVLVLSLCVCAVLAPLAAPYNPREQNTSLTFKSASLFHGFLNPGSQAFLDFKSHVMGTDNLGRDWFSRLVYGARLSLSVGFFAQAVVLSIGLPIGMMAGFFGGKIDNLLMRFTDLVYAFPELLFIILLRTVVGGGLFSLFLIIGLVHWVDMARLVRGQILSLKEREFVEAARAIGASDRDIMVRHLLPNTLGPIIVVVTFGIPRAVFVEASLSFIGIGVGAGSSSWGSMIQEGYSAIFAFPHLVMFPAIAIAILMLSFTFIGDGLRDALDPRTR